MNKYRKINVDLNRQYRNDLNWNFGQISDDMASVGKEIDRVEKDLSDTIDSIVGGGFIESLETARDNANDAAINANEKASYADGRGKYADEKGDYAKEQGDYAKLKGDYADEKAILADQAAANASAEASNLEGMKIAAVDATQAANNAANDAIDKADYADGRGQYANTQGQRAENAVDAIDNITKDGPVLSVNGQVGLAEITSEDINYVSANSFNEDDPITCYLLGVTVMRVNFSTNNSWLGYTNYWGVVETVRTTSTAHGVQTLTRYTNGTLVSIHKRISVGTSSNPLWSDWKQVILDDNYATEDSYGVVKVDGKTIVSNDGVLSALIPSSVTWMYHEGEEFEELTGGWRFNYFNPDKGENVKEDDHLYLRVESNNERRKWRTLHVIDTSQYEKIKVELEGASETSNADSSIKIILHNRNTEVTPSGEANTTLTSEVVEKGVYELDVSTLSGEYYLGIMAYNGPGIEAITWCKVYKVWGE